MHIISRSPFVEAAKKYPNDADALDSTYKMLRNAVLATPDEMKAMFSSLNRMKYREKWWVIDVGGNNLRVIFYANFEHNRLFIKHISTHSEYDKLVKFYRENKE